MSTAVSVISPAAVEVEDRTGAAKARLATMVATTPHGLLQWERPGRSAAFSRRDTLLPGFDAAAATAEAAGFTPFIRPVGGRLAAYHESSLVLDLLLRSTEPRSGISARFAAFSEALADGLQLLGVDARIGQVPDEYCPGEWSVNHAGRIKLIGTGQRIVRDAVQLTAVIVVRDPDPLRDVMCDVYDDLDLPIDPWSVGAVSDAVPGVTLDDVQSALEESVAAMVGLGPADDDGTRPLLHRWDPR
mgnify:CR=1 FL=1